MDKKLLKSIRKSAGKLTADRVKQYGSSEVQAQIYEALKSRDFGARFIAMSDQIVETLLSEATVIALDLASGSMAELKDSEEARAAITKSIMVCGKSLKPQAQQALKGIFGGVVDVVAKTISEIVTDAMVERELDGDMPLALNAPSEEDGE